MLHGVGDRQDPRDCLHKRKRARGLRPSRLFCFDPPTTSPCPASSAQRAIFACAAAPLSRDTAHRRFRPCAVVVRHPLTLSRTCQLSALGHSVGLAFDPHHYDSMAQPIDHRGHTRRTFKDLIPFLERLISGDHGGESGIMTSGNDLVRQIGHVVVASQVAELING